MQQKPKIENKEKKVKVLYWEMDRFSGRKLDREEELPYSEAVEKVAKYNSYNKEKSVPDWYMYAEIEG